MDGSGFLRVLSWVVGHGDAEGHICGEEGTETGVASWRCGQFSLKYLVYLGRGDQHMDISV